MLLLVFVLALDLLGVDRAFEILRDKLLVLNDRVDVVLAMVVRVEGLRGAGLRADAVAVLHIDGADLRSFLELVLLLGEERALHLLVGFFELLDVDVDLAVASAVGFLAGKLFVKFVELVIVMMREQLVLLVDALVEALPNALVTRVLDLALGLIEQIC